MKMQRSTILACSGIALLGLALACSGEPRPAAEPAPEPAAAPEVAPAPAEPTAAAEPNPAELEPTPEELPVLEDFEEEVAQQVTLANYRKELDELEKELDSKN